MRRIDTPKPRRKSPRAGAGAKSVTHAVAQAEAVEQNKAITDILRVISSSPTDLAPVFATILSHASRLCQGDAAVLWQYDGSHLHFAASGRAETENAAYLRKNPLPLGRYNPTPQAALEKRTLHVADVFANRKYRPLVPKDSFGTLPNAGTVLAVPLLRQDELFGVISIWRFEKRAFADEQIAMVETFAAQAAIAIHNVRLLNETKQALEQQTATAEILRVISSSPTDIQPVLDAVAESAARLCEATDAVIALRRADGFGFAAHYGTIPITGTRALTRESVAGRAILEGRQFHIRDLQSETKEFPQGSAFAKQFGYRTMLATPLMREGSAIGAILVRRTEARPFSEVHLALVRTFAGQAVIAIENVRLFNETKEALEQQTATAEILRVISSSPSDLKPVFDTILDNALRLCEASNGQAYLYDGAAYDLVGFRGADALTSEPWRRVISPGPHTGLGRILSERAPVHIPDLLEDVATSERDPMRMRTIERLGARTFLAVPLLKDQGVAGALVIYRREVRPFSGNQIALIKTFAAQAVIAIENVRLFTETKEALEQQTAISEVLRVISDFPTDVNPVLHAVAVRAARICDASDSRLFLVDGGDLRHVAGFGDIPTATQVGESLPLDRESVTGRAVLDRTPMHVHDLATEASGNDFPRSRAMHQRTGYRAALAVPLLREGRALGAIVLRRMEVRPFTEKQIALLKTFADQAAIAIENVRLFNETKEALDHQTSTAEVLKTISRSTFDLGSVLQTLLDNATRLSGAHRAMMLRPDPAGDYLPAVTFNYPVDSPVVARLREHPIRPGRDSTSGRVLLERKPIHIADVLADPEYLRRELVDAGGFRTALSVPMLRDGEAIGLITLTKGAEVDPFTEKQMEVVTTFADQAVIAIENVRLFKEIEEKSAQLEVANKHKSDFLANMSHELRTPLNAIIGFSEALMEKMFGELNEKQADYLKDIHESGNHLLSLINDILDLSKIEAGRMELELTSFDMPSAISNAMTLVRERAQRHGIELGLEVDKRLGEFQADERKFKQILLNLLSNAVKFTPDGGRVDVSARLNGGKAEISVKDSGIGITPEDQASLFEEFKQVGRDYTRKAEGTGLGLALTKRFVELHGGEIKAESAPGKGSTFTVYLPVR